MTKTLPLLLAASGLLLATACADKVEDSGDSGIIADADTDTDADTDADSDADADSDTDADTNPYTTYNGSETLWYSKGAETKDASCELKWDVTGTPQQYLCDGCEWIFDVDMTFNAGNSTGADHEDCSDRAVDFSFVYGFTEDYYGYGPTLLYVYDYYGYLYPYAWSDTATWDGTNMTWGWADPNDAEYYADEYGYYPDYKGYNLYAQVGDAVVE